MFALKKKISKKRRKGFYHVKRKDKKEMFAIQIYDKALCHISVLQNTLKKSLTKREIIQLKNGKISEQLPHVRDT